MNALLLLGLAVSFAVLSLTGCMESESDENSSSMEWVSYDEGIQLAKKQGKPIVLNFYADWCPDCKKMDKITFENQEVIEKSKDFVCIKVNTEVNPELTKEFNIKFILTTIVYTSDGKILFREEDAVDPLVFLELMEKALNYK